MKPCIDCNSLKKSRNGVRCKSCANRNKWKNGIYLIRTGKSYEELFGKSKAIQMKNRLSAIHKGKNISKELRQKISLGLKGKSSKERNPMWKGGVTSQDRLERVKFRSKMQKQIFERDNYTCQLCGEIGGQLQVDHIQSWKDYVELRFSMDNCRTLCMDCHYLITYGKPKPKNIKTWGHNLERRIVT